MWCHCLSIQYQCILRIVVDVGYLYSIISITTFDQIIRAVTVVAISRSFAPRIILGFSFLFSSALLFVGSNGMHVRPSQTSEFACGKSDIATSLICYTAVILANPTAKLAFCKQFSFTRIQMNVGILYSVLSTYHSVLSTKCSVLVIIKPVYRSDEVVSDDS